MRALDDILRESSFRHKRVCPRQVLGARMGLLAGELLGLDLPRADKRLLVIAETDGCTLDGLIAATGCHVGGRTLRILDFGKVAATFIDVYTEAAVRLAPKRESRSLAWDYIPAARNRWESMLQGYQIIPAEKLFGIQRVRLKASLEQIIGRPAMKTECELCCEEIMNGREVIRSGLVLCRSCAGEDYVQLIGRSQSRLPEKIMTG